MYLELRVKQRDDNILEQTYIIVQVLTNGTKYGSKFGISPSKD